MVIRKRWIGWSVALHLLLVIVLTVGIDARPDKVRHVAPGKEIVQAKVIDAAAVEAEAQKLKAAEEKKRRAAEQRQRELEKKRVAEEKKLADLKAEQERARAAEKAAQKRKEAAEREAKQAKKLAAEAARKKAEAEKQRQEEEQRRRAEQAEKERRAAEAREAERQRIEQALQDEMAAEEAARQAAAQAAADASEIDRYVAAIAARVRQSFTILPGLDGLSCTLRIRLIPGGEVAAVQIVKSSGNPTFDRQAENAVRKASPLPVPTDPRLFQQMRSISFVFDPQY